MSRSKVKGILTLMMVLGAVAMWGGGTFASFSAETSNAGSSLASGTLTLENKVNSGTACLSAGAASTNNFNAACEHAFALTNVAPGVFGGIAKITVENTGSLDASKLYLWAPQANATLSGSLTSGNAVTSLTISALEGSVANTDSIVVSYGGHEQTFVANAAASGGATTISVTSQTANFSYPVGSTASDSNSNKSPSNTDCYDAKTTVSGTVGATNGTELNFNPVSGNPLCGTALLFVQETTGGSNYCWSGNGVESASGMCKAPISVNLSSKLSTGGPITSLPVAALNGNVASTDSVLVTSGAETQTFTASANAYIGATSIAVNSLTPNFAYPTTSTVTDPTTLGKLNSDTTDTISNFDTAHSSTGKIQLFPTTSNGNVEKSASVELSHYNSGTYQRTFEVGVYVPSLSGGNQNALQGLASTFGLTWHIDQ